MPAAIYESLRSDHDTQRDLLARIDATSGDTEERRDLFAQLAQELRAHALAEEKSLYAAMMAVEHGQEKARHSVHEHQQMDEMLEDLESIEMSSSAWIAKFRELRERTEHHLTEEEHEVFQFSGRVLSEGDKERLEPIYSNAKAAAV